MNKMKRGLMAAVLALIPVAAVAAPVVGIGYSNISVDGGAGKPGVSIGAAQLYPQRVLLSGAATYASGFRGIHMSLGKMIGDNTLAVEPLIRVGALHANYTRHGTRMLTTPQSSPYGSFTSFEQVPTSTPASISAGYVLAGANLYWQPAHDVHVSIGGGFGHTIFVSGLPSGTAYQGGASVSFGIAKNVIAGIDVSYLHLPGHSIRSEGASIGYQF